MQKISLATATVFVLFLSVVAPKPALASERFFFGAALFYATETVEAGDTETDVTKLFTNATAGMILASGIGVGIKYINLDETSKAGSSEARTSVSGYGLSAGYFHKSGFSVLASYIFEPEKESTFDPNETLNSRLYGGDGTVIDIGYVFGDSSWAVGPQFSIVNAKYKKAEALGTETDLTTDYEETYSYPYVVLYLYF